MLRRLDVRKPEPMWLETTFESAESERVPSAYYVPASLTAALERLRAHGIRMDRLSEPTNVALEEFHIDSSQVQPRAFQGHQERTVTGKYEPVEKTLPAGTYRISMNQPLARLAFYMMEPRCPDGLLAWSFLDAVLKDAKTYPIVRTRN